MVFQSSFAFSSSHGSSTTQDGVSDKNAAILKYLEEYGTASTAYNDLRPFVEQLVPEDRSQLLVILKTKFKEQVSHTHVPNFVLHVQAALSPTYFCF